MTDFGWIDLCYVGRQQQNCCSSHLQAIVSELDCIIKDVEGKNIWLRGSTSADVLIFFIRMKLLVRRAEATGYAKWAKVRRLWVGACSQV